MFLWGNKKVSGDIGGAMGHLALPRSEALPPHTPLTRTKMAKISQFWLFIFLPLTPTPSQQKIIWCSHCAISNLVLRLVKIFSGVKMAVKACKIFTWVKYKWLGKNTNWTTEKSRLHHPPPSHFDGLPYSQVRWYPQLFSSKWPQGCKRDYLGALGHFL